MKKIILMCLFGLISISFSLDNVRLSLGADIQSILGNDSSSDDTPIILPGQFEIDCEIPINKSIIIGGGLTISQSTYKGTSDMKISHLGGIAFLQYKNFRAGFLITTAEIKQDNIYADMTGLSPFVGANFLFADNKMGLELRNYFSLYWVDDVSSDYEGFVTEQLLLLKFYLF